MTERQGHFEVYPQHHDPPEGSPEGTKGEPTGEYGWRYRAGNGHITAVGGEGFTSRHTANKALHNFLRAVSAIEPHPAILDVDD